MIDELTQDFGDAVAAMPAECARQPAVEYLHGALRLSSHVLARDPLQLAGQLHGRLLHVKCEEVAALLEEARRRVARPWIRPIRACLSRPDGELLQTIAAHTDRIMALAVTPDSRIAVSASWDCKAKVWDIETGGHLLSIEGHNAHVNDVAVSNDGTLVATASSDGTARVWDIATGRCMSVLESRGPYLTAVAFLPDARRLVTGGASGVIEWDIGGQRELRRFKGHKDISEVAVSPSGKWLVSCGKQSDDKGEVHLHDLATGELAGQLIGPKSRTVRACISPDGQHLFVGWGGPFDGEIRQYDIGSCRCLAQMAGSIQQVLDLAVTPDGGWVLATDEWKLSLWDTNRKVSLRQLRDHTAPVSAVAVTPDGRYALSAGSGELKVWRAAGLLAHGESDDHRSEVDYVGITPDERFAVTVSTGDGVARVWDLPTGKRTQDLASDARIQRVAPLLHPGGNRVLTAWSDRKLRAFDLHSGQCVALIEGHTVSVSNLAAAPHYRVLASGGFQLGKSGELLLWDTHGGTSGELLANTFLGPGPLEFTPDGHFLLVGGNEIEVWDIETRERIRTLTPHEKNNVALVAAPDGRHVVSAYAQYGAEGKVIVWDLQSGQRVAEWTGHYGGSHGIAVSPDGTSMLSIRSRTEIELRDLRNGERLATLRPREAGPCAVAISGDGELAATATYGGLVSVWDLPSCAEMASFYTDGPIRDFAQSWTGQTIAAAEASGRLDLLALTNVVPGPAVTTAWDSAESDWLGLGCPACRKWFLVTRCGIATELPCKHCGRAIRLNSFVLLGDWRPIAEAWSAADTTHG